MPVLSLAAVLDAIVQHESLDATCAALGVGRDELVRLLREAAGAKAEQTSLFAGPRTKPQPPPAPSAPPPTTPLPAKLRKVVIHADGASRGNPGPAGAGAVVSAPDGAVIARLGKFLGTQTNNVAEYEGVLLGLGWALEHGVTDVSLRADSLLVINQLNGEWKVKHPGLKPFHERASALLRQFAKTDLAHVRREFNEAADEMSNRAIDERM